MIVNIPNGSTFTPIYIPTYTPTPISKTQPNISSKTEVEERGMDGVPATLAAITVVLVVIILAHTILKISIRCIRKCMENSNDN